MLDNRPIFKTILVFTSGAIIGALICGLTFRYTSTSANRHIQYFNFAELGMTALWGLNAARGHQDASDKLDTLEIVFTTNLVDAYRAVERGDTHHPWVLEFVREGVEYRRSYPFYVSHITEGHPWYPTYAGVKSELDRMLDKDNAQ